MVATGQRMQSGLPWVQREESGLIADGIEREILGLEGTF
jgi:hypothetical protein